MALEFKDRLAKKPGRVRIVPENGATPYYAVIERADDATVPGTPLTAANLNLAQENLIYSTDTGMSTWKRVFLSPTGNDANTGATVDVPMATVKAAVRKYAKWHKYLDIYLLDGTYTEDIGQIATDQCSVSIRGQSENKDAVTINMATMLESHITLLRLYHLTITMTAKGVRPISVNSGELFANFVRFNMPADSSSNLINVYNASSAWLKDCILNAGTGSAVYGNQAMHIRAVECTSERTLSKGFNANNGTLIEYTPTLTATTMVTETNGGKCVLNAAKPGTVEGAMGSLYGRYRTFDGLLLQWGTVSITPSEAGKPTSGRVTFAIPFTETPVVFATAVTSVPQSCNLGAARASVTDPKTQVDIVLTRSDTTTTVVNWFAIGKGAST